MGKHMELAGRIRELRLGRKWTQMELSRASGLTRSYISRLEMGDIALPANEKLRALAAALGTSTDDLLQAAGYLDASVKGLELPEIKVYLRRKYRLQDVELLSAVEAIVLGLRAVPEGKGERHEERKTVHMVEERQGEE